MTRADFELAAALLCACAAGSCAVPAFPPAAGAPGPAFGGALNQHQFVPIGGIEQ